MSRLDLIYAAVLAGALCVAPHAAAASDVAGGGAVTGRVWFPNEFPESESFKIPKDNDVCGIRKDPLDFIVDEDSHGLKNVVLELRGVTGGKALDLPAPVLGQKSCTYEPHVQVVRSGAPVEFTNSDPVLHNIHGYAEDRTIFNIAQPPIGNLKFKKDLPASGVVKVVCDVHDWMVAYIYVVDHPYVALTDGQGAYAITDVPPGTYTLAIWHEGLGELTREVTIGPGQTVTEDIEIGK